MIRYMSYLYANVRKKWSTYLIPLFGALVLIAVLLPSILTNTTDTPVIGNTLVFYYFLPFVFGAMFVGTKTLNIFKDGEEDGTELLIVSKPISRGQIVLGKFITLYSLIIGYALWSFITTVAVGFVDDNATTTAVMNFAGGYALGSLIIMVIFSAIITFFATVFGKIGTMTLSIIVPALLPIVSFILVPVGKGTVQGELGSNLGRQSVYSVNVDKNTGKMISVSDPSYIYDESTQSGDAIAYRKSVKDKQDGFYKYVSYFDVWQHMFGFYSVLQEQKLTTSSQGVKLAQSGMKLSTKDGIVLSDGSGENYLFTPLGSSGDGRLDYALIPSTVNKVIDLASGITLQSGKTFSEDTDQVKKELETKDEFNKIIDGYSSDSLVSYVTAALIKKQNLIVSDLATISDDATYDQNMNDYRIFKLDSNQEVNFQVLNIKKYHSTADIIAIYAVIAVVLSGLVIFRYYRRDFK